MRLEKPLNSQRLMCCYGILEDKNVERGANDEALACEVSEERKDSTSIVWVIYLLGWGAWGQERVQDKTTHAQAWGQSSDGNKPKTTTDPVPWGPDRKLVEITTI